MFLSKISIKGFRNFANNEILFNEGINVLIGHNNSGKTNLIKALSLVLGSNGIKRLCIDDFNKYLTLDELKQSPPEIIISVTISQNQQEDLYSDDLVTVGNWLTKLEPPYEARLTYVYFLPEKEREKYKKFLENIGDIDNAWRIIENEFLRLYTSKIYGGNASLKNSAESDALQKFDFQFLDAIRDVERDMFSGRNTLLKEVLEFFLDYEVKNATDKTKEEKEDTIRQKREIFFKNAEGLISSLKTRIGEGKKEILSYASETGASFQGAVPDFDGSLSEVDLFSALNLIVKYKTGITIPATHNGLGYNNLIFMSLLLSKMQVDSDGSYLGSNAKVYPILAIEEPEAHLHPSMQYKFLKFLRENKEDKKKVRQIFITTHSTQITSAVSLDEIICLFNNEDKVEIGYPGKVFSNNTYGKKAKAYVKRFLDATKSDMLFAQKVILVEGMAEQILFSTLAKYNNTPLEDKHIAVINVGGRYFEYFLKLFDSKIDFAINKKVACVTDRDPTRKKRTGKYFEKCYPFEYNQDINNYEYQNNASSLISQYAKHPNIRFFSQNENKGKTFEYDLVTYNPTLELLLTDSMCNKEELKALMTNYKDMKSIACFEEKLRDSDVNERIINSIKSSSTFNEEDKKKAIIAARYLNSIDKGENALELNYHLEENLRKSDVEKINLPIYIKEALDWIWQ